MKAPLLLRLAPAWLKPRLLSRLYLPAAARWRPLFDAAPLTYAPKYRMQLLPSDFMHAEIAFRGVYEPALSRCVWEDGRAGGLFVDVGANAGYFTILWAAANPENRVLAIEAAPQCAALLRRNIDTNGLSERVDICEYALGRDNGILPFDLGPAELTGWGGLATVAGERTIEVPVRRLDDVANKLVGERRIDLLKIDVEGADTWVLKGAEAMLRGKRIRRIWYEQNKPRLAQLGIGEREAGEFLTRLGYHVRPMTPENADIVDWMAVPA